MWYQHWDAVQREHRVSLLPDSHPSPSWMGKENSKLIQKPNNSDRMAKPSQQPKIRDSDYYRQWFFWSFKYIFELKSNGLMNTHLIKARNYTSFQSLSCHRQDTICSFKTHYSAHATGAAINGDCHNHCFCPRRHYGGEVSTEKKQIQNTDRSRDHSKQSGDLFILLLLLNWPISRYKVDRWEETEFHWRVFLNQLLSSVPL